MDTLEKINALANVQGTISNVIRYLAACDEADAVLNGDRITSSPLYESAQAASELLRDVINDLSGYLVTEVQLRTELPADREEPVLTDAPGTMTLHESDEVRALLDLPFNVNTVGGDLVEALLGIAGEFDCDCVFCAVGKALDAGDVQEAKNAFNALVDLTEESEMVRDHLETVLKELASSDHYPTAVTAAEALAVVGP